ncbi:inositol monophosphatase family protein [Ahrensia marina]|uniref:inositol monophosphatase family protein n=1 Tax=Ahrensia marina TaxID=1514904 RepID=UPI0035D0BF70
MTSTHPASQSSTLETQALEARLAIACEVVRRAGQEARKAWQAGSLAVDVKGHQDFVTAIDRDTETLIRNELTNAFPGDGVLGEEFGGPKSDGPLWVVDPIDGTTNFIRGLADWAVSLALVEGTQLHLGIIYDGGRDCLYWARAGHGAYIEGKPVRCADTPDPNRALIMLGTNSHTPLDHHLTDHRKLDALGAAYRRHGSAATGLLMVADGRVDAYYERSLNAWDALGGLCIAQEAGAVVTAQKVDQFLRTAGPVLCTAPAIAAPIGDVLASGLTANSVSKW